ncbi:MAG: Pimeloyl-ACP methyl ester carboxylesterase [Microbacteriaceae bacterium]|nr:Pimeloyl-ACP methyl ester carboxylesterase [Microbacteriaceae bacterium]
MTVIRGARGAIGYDTFGDDGAPQLLLIQGFSAQRLGWRPGFCQAVADRGFRVIRHDNRDVGQSEHFPAGGYTLPDLADDTASLLDELGIESAHIVGQSMGGMIAQLLATGHPSRVRSLGLLYTAANTNHFINADEQVAAASTAVAPITREEFVASYVVSEGNCASPGYPQDTAWLAELGGRMWDNAGGADYDGIGRQLQALLAYTDRVEDDRTIAVPTVVIAGDGDGLIDHSASLEVHEAIPGSTLTIFPGMGHELPEPLWPAIADLLAANAHRA